MYSQVKDLDATCDSDPSLSRNLIRLLVTPTGGRLWRLRYRIGNLEKLISLGAYPDVPLKRAREKRDEARRLVADEIDPSADRKAKRAAMLTHAAVRFGLLPLRPASSVKTESRTDQE